MTQQPNNPPSPTHSPVRHRATRTTLSVPLDVGEGITSVERRDGRIITTIVKVELDNGSSSPLSFASLATPLSPAPPAISPPTAPTVSVAAQVVEGYPTDNESDSNAESVVVVDGNQPPVPDPTRTGLSGPPMVPVPTELRRPANDSPTTRYYVVFAGLRVGIWSGNFWDSALWHYAAAYQGAHPFRKGVYKETAGWNPHLEGTIAIENPKASDYTWGTGPKIGEVDVGGLDLVANRLPYYVDEVPPNDA
ncbi:hypothetical protein V5O48_012981 [Marasmius crinis-equi]|uniref:Uncharacterized protein n=1 Tax=Marasmius crinis-equi TaxID=585013 RepID=A0ABR3F1A5_9AGAR